MSVWSPSLAPSPFPKATGLSMPHPSCLSLFFISSDFPLSIYPFDNTDPFFPFLSLIILCALFFSFPQNFCPSLLSSSLLQSPQVLPRPSLHLSFLGLSPSSSLTFILLSCLLLPPSRPAAACHPLCHCLSVQLPLNLASLPASVSLLHPAYWGLSIPRGPSLSS